MAATWARRQPALTSTRRPSGARRRAVGPQAHAAATPLESLARPRRTQCRAAAGAGASDLPEPAGAAGAGGATCAQALFNYANVIMGAGWVAMPYAWRQGGLLAAPAVLWALCAAFAWTGLVVLDACARLDSRRAGGGAAAGGGPRAGAGGLGPAAGYEDVAGAAFGALGRGLVAAVMYLELLGISTVYLVLEAEALSALLSGAPLGAAVRAALPGGPGFVLLASALVVPTVLLPDLASLSGLGLLSVASALAVGAALTALWLTGGGTAVAGGTARGAVQLAAPATLPQMLGCVAFVYAGHSTFPVVQQSMRQPERAPSVLLAAYVSVAAVCTLVGTFGYLLYGHGTADVITANLPPGPAATAGLLLTAVSPLAAFALTLEPVALALQRAAARDAEGRPPYAVRAAVRLALSLVCVAAAAVLPYVADLMSLVGALLTMSVSLILPALMAARLPRTPGGGPPLGAAGAARAGGVLLLGLVCAAVGADSALSSLRAKMTAAAAAGA